MLHSRSQGIPLLWQLECDTRVLLEMELSVLPFLPCRVGRPCVPMWCQETPPPSWHTPACKDCPNECLLGADKTLENEVINVSL